jgi:hypothetical protein
VITASFVGRIDTHYDGASMGASLYFVNAIFTRLGKIKKYNMPSIMFIFLEERRIGLDVKQHSVYRFVKRVKCFNIVFTKIYDISTSANN